MNWMTATGFALIAGGVATLICFRRVLWSGQHKRRDATRRRTLVPVLPAQGSAPEISGAHLTAVVHDDMPTGERTPGRHWERLDRDGRDGWRRGYRHGEEHRPQPRPHPGAYVGRHAAEEQR
jgi:hypothetical protein